MPSIHKIYLKVSHLQTKISISYLQDLLDFSEANIKELGVKNSAHRARIVSSLVVLKKKYNKGKTLFFALFYLNPSSRLRSGLRPNKQVFHIFITFEN